MSGRNGVGKMGTGTSIVEVWSPSMKSLKSSPVTFFLIAGFSFDAARTMYGATSGFPCRYFGYHFTPSTTQHFFALAPPSPQLRRCEGEKMLHPSSARVVLAKARQTLATPGGSPRRRNHLDDLLSVPAQHGAGHSLLLAPNGDLRKR
jgi:hypothetical protein